MAKIFISYSRKDKEFVEIIEPQIYNIYGYASLWYDRSIPGGDKWWQKINLEIKDCELFLFLMSDSSVNSMYCRQELSKAFYNTKTVLPVLLKTYTQEYPENLPSELYKKMSEIQHIDFRQGYNDLSLLWGAINKIRDRSLSRVNRWMLSNQFEILRLLHHMIDEEGNSEDYKRQQTIIRMGYEWNYDQISEHIAIDTMEYGDGEEVINILFMYELISKACNTRENCLDIDSPYREFQGFSENYEGDYYFFTKFIIEVEGRFTECKPDKESDLNSHRPMLPKYRRMVKEWQSSDDPYSLTKEDIIRILDA